MLKLDHKAILEALANCFDLHGLSDEDREKIAPHFESRRYRAGETISVESEPEGDEALVALGQLAASVEDERRGLYVIADGLVQVTHRSQQRRAPVAHVLGPGGLFGEEALVGGGLVSAEAYRESHLLRLAPKKIDWARQHLPSFGPIVERLAQIQLDAPWIVDCLRSAALFRRVPPRFLYQLLEGAEIIALSLRQQIVTARTSPGGIYVVLAGEVELVDEETGWIIRVLRRGEVFGDIEFLGSRGTAYHVRGGPESAEVIKIAEERIYDLLSRSSTFRRCILACEFGTEEQRGPLIARAYEREHRAINLVAMTSDDPTVPLGTMIEWLAEASAAEFGDDVIILRLDDKAPLGAPQVTVRQVGDGSVEHAVVHPGSPLIASGELDQRAMKAHYVFVDIRGMESGPFAERIPHAERTVLVATRPYEDLPERVISRLPRPLLYTAVVPSPRLREGKEPRVPAGNVRIHRDLIAAARRGGPYSSLDPLLQEQVGRWARAITDRRVGIALGGGGAFGFAHLPLLEAIQRARIPIDIISGCSVGAATGAWFAARGMNGIDEFLAQSGGIMFGASLLTSRYIAGRLDASLQGVRLEDLLVNFYPVVCDIDTACQTTLRYGTVGLGVRASCSFPGFLTPTLVERRDLGREMKLQRLIDGGVINIVPDDTLYLEGAQVAIASNVIPPPRARSPLPPFEQKLRQLLDRGPALLGEIWREIDPWERVDDLLRTTYIMMHEPQDWEGRSADAKFRASPGAYAPMDWEQGARIKAAQNPKDIASAVEQLRSAYTGLRWRRPSIKDEAA